MLKNKTVAAHKEHIPDLQLQNQLNMRQARISSAVTKELTFELRHVCHQHQVATNIPACSCMCPACAYVL